MINNLIIKKKLVQLGLTSLALVNGAINLGCGRVVEAEEAKEILSIIEVENTELATTTPKVTVAPSVTPTIAPTNTPSPTSAPTPTQGPSPTPYDPYTLTNEEAIEIGTYIYDDYIKYYTTVEGSFFQKYAGEYTKEDMINIVCLFNQKYPALYPNRASACSSGDLQNLITFCEDVINVKLKEALNEGKARMFRYSELLKDGRPEKELLEKLENDFLNISSGNVSNEDIFKCWGDAIKLAINAEETFNGWDNFDTLMFYYMLRGEYYYFLNQPEVFNNLPCYIPSEYVFENRKGMNLYLKDAFSYISTTTKQKYSGLTNAEYDSYIGCFDKILAKFNEKNIDGDNYIKQRKKNSN